MTPGDWAVIIASGLGGLAGVAALWRVVVDRSRGVSSDEREVRRDTIADRDSLIERLERRLEQVEERLTAAEDGNIAKALIIRANHAHMDVLERWIWDRKEPPPPPRPDIIGEGAP